MWDTFEETKTEIVWRENFWAEQSGDCVQFLMYAAVWITPHHCSQWFFSKTTYCWHKEQYIHQ